MSENIDSRSRSDSSEVAFRKIFIGGLSYSTDEEKLKKYFKTYGSVQDAVVMKDPVSKRSRGFGFITFYDVSSVDNALANEPHTIDSRKVEAKRAVPRSEIAKEMVLPAVSQKSTGSSSVPVTSPSHSVSSSTTASPQVSSYKSVAASNSGYSSSGSTSSAQIAIESRHAVDPKINMDEYAYNKIFVGGLHYDTRDAEFRCYFEKYGKVISAEVMFNRETHKSRGFGFIVFEMESTAVKVCNEKEHSIDSKVVEVKRAIPRSKIAVGCGPAVSPATATSKSLNASPPIAATTTSGSAAVNMRSDVRRAMSEESAYSSAASNSGSAKLSSLAPPPLSSILSSASSNSSLSNAIRKPYNAAVTGGSGSSASGAPVTPSAGLRAGTTSYAAALKQGGSGGSGATATSAVGSASSAAGGSSGSGHHAALSSLDGDSGITSLDISSVSNLTSASLSPTHLNNSGGSSALTGGIDLQSLLNNSQIPGLEQLNRPYRSYSEPIVKVEGSSSLNGEILTQFDLNNYSRLGPSAAIGRSNNSSRSSSILATQSLSESGSSRRQSFDLMSNSQVQQQQQQQHSLGQASNHTSSNSLANIPWLSSPPSLSLDPGDTSGLHSSNSAVHMPGPLSLLLPGPVATTTGSAGAAGGAGGRSNGGSSSIGGSVTPGNTVENLFGLPNNPPPATTTPTSFSAYQSITSMQALQHHQQQQYLQLQEQQAQQQQQLQQQQQQQLHAYHSYQQSPHQSFNGYSGSLLDANGMAMLPPAHHQQQQQQQPGGPSADAWANMVINHQRQEQHQMQQQQQHMLQQYPPYLDQHLHQYHHQQQPVPPQQQYGGAYFSPSGGSQPHPSQFQQQQQHLQHQQLQQQQQQAMYGAQPNYPGSPYFAGGSARSSSTLSMSPSSQALQAQSLPPPGAATASGSYLPGGRSEGTEGDDLFKFNDLHLDSAEFDPKAPWLYANKH